jgi:hypothetical protein
VSQDPEHDPLPYLLRLAENRNAASIGEAKIDRDDVKSALVECQQLSCRMPTRGRAVE